MERYELDRIKRRNTIKEREQKEKNALLATKALLPVRETSINRIAKMNSGERSNLRRRIFENHEITNFRAKVSTERAMKEQKNLN